MKFPLTFKMLLVVAIPLAIQLIFIAVLSSNLNELASEQKIAQREAIVVMAHDRIIINERLRTVLITMYLATLDQYCRDKFMEVCSDTPAVFNTIGNLWRGDKARIDGLNKLWKSLTTRDKMSMGALSYTGQKLNLEELMGGSDPNKYMLRRAMLVTRIPHIEQFCEEDERQKNAAYEAISKRLDLLRKLLWAGLAASIAAALVSEFVFSRSVSKRLLVVLKNIKALGENQKGLVAMKDSDEISALNESVVQTASKIRDAEEFQAQSLAIIAEELNKPLTEVAAILHELPKTGFEELNQKGAKRLNDSLIEIERLENLVFELVNLDSANRIPDVAAIETDSLISNCLKIVEPLTKLKAITVVKSDSSETEAFGDIAKTTQVLINLLSNAIKYSPDAASIEIKTTTNADEVQISVRDHGPGIPQEFQSKIFQRFEQAGVSPNKPTSASSGLGLVISKEIIESQGGKIGFESGPGEGSTFWFTLPLTRKDAAQADVNSKPNAVERGWKPTLWKKALLVVALPVVVQSLTIAAMFNFLNQNAEKILQTQKLSQMTSVHQKLLTGISRAGLFAMLYNVERDPKNLANARFEQGELRKNIAKLDELAASDAATKNLNSQVIDSIKAHLIFEDHVIAAKQNADTSSFIGAHGTDSDKKQNLLADIRKPLNDLYAQQNDLIESNEQTLGEIRRSFELLLILSAIVASAIAGTLGLLIARSFTGRTSRLSEAALNFSINRELIQPQKGDDELAYVEQQLYLASKKLMDLEVTRAEMVGITSHELRTPLTSLIALIEVIEAGVFGTLTERGQALLAKARLETSELIVLITNLLDLEKMESGKVLVTKSRIKIENIFEQIKFENSQPASTKDIALNIKDCAQEIDGDSQRLSQALTAVIRSILDRVPPKSAVSLECQRTPSTVVLTIAAPHGVAVGRKNKIKEFARERMAISLARMTAKQHGGDLNMTTSNKGRVFEIQLPLN